MSEKMKGQSVEMPESVQTEDDKERLSRLQGELLKYLGLDFGRRKLIDLSKAQAFVNSNPELLELSQTQEFKKRLSHIVSESPEFVSQVGRIFSYSPADIEDVFFYSVTAFSFIIEENLEKVVKKFGLSQAFTDRVTDESIIMGLTQANFSMNLSYGMKRLAALGNQERVGGIIKTAITRQMQRGDFISFGGWFPNVHEKFATVFDVDSFVKSPEMKVATIKRLREPLIAGNFSDIEAWIEFADLSRSDVVSLDEAAHYIDTLFYAELPTELENGDDPFWGFRDTRKYFHNLEKVMQLFSLPDDFYDTNVFQKAIVGALDMENWGPFRNCDKVDIKPLIKKYHVRTAILESPRFKEALIKKVCTLIKIDDATGLTRAQKTLENFNVLKLSDPEFRDPLAKVIVSLIEQRANLKTDSAVIVKKIEELLTIACVSNEEKTEIGIRACLSDITTSRGRYVSEIQKVLGIKNSLTLPEYISAAEGVLTEALNTFTVGGISNLHVSDQFLSKPEIRESALRALTFCIQNSQWVSVRELKDVFGFEDNVIIEISLNRINGRLIIAKATRETNDNDEAEEDDGDMEDFIFSLKLVAPSLTAEHIRKSNPKIQNYIDVLQDRFPFIGVEKLQSLEFCVFLVETVNNFAQVISALEKSPFLVRAMDGNPRFAIKLLRQYPKLDKLSQENITLLYELKSKAASADLPSESVREEINRKLIGYKNNPKVAEAYSNEGIEMGSWLNFPLETEFNLTASSELVSAAAISKNAERLSSSYGKFLDNMRSGIEEYKDNLATARLPSVDFAELDERIAKMRVRKAELELSGDQKSSTGIQKGIDNLERQKTNDKGVSVLLKMTSEFSKAEQKLAAFSNTFEELKKAEALLKEFGEFSPGGEKGFPVFDIAFGDLERAGKLPASLKGSTDVKPVEIIAEGNLYEKFFTQKAKVNELKKACHESMNQFMGGFDSLTKWLARDLSKALGSERYSAIVQEARQNLGLDNDHIESDNRTMKSFFDEHRELSLDGRPMKISLWNRDPDVDLYLGNYTDCCIRIDSDYHGSECVISDYLTDLGVQVLVVSDEKEEKPVLAAWLWIGKEESTGEVSLVIDNIEANTDYTIQFGKAIEDKLREYIRLYTEALEVDSVVQGDQNNDLVVADLIVKRKYKKIGGYNRADGYYLEAEAA
jgi:hypothetical protein